ncbi:MAG: PEP-CTERM sorting domain-containing protein [Planctomycetota bacterium]
MNFQFASSVVVSASLFVSGQALGATISTVSFNAVAGSIDSITVDETGDLTTYDSSEFIGTALTAYADSSSPLLLDIGGSTLSFSPNSSAVSDNQVDTGYANFDSMTVTLDQAVVNDGNAILFLVDVGFPPDDFTVTINGESLFIPSGSNNGFELVTGPPNPRPFGIYNTTTPSVASVADLDTAVFTVVNPAASSGRRLIGIDIEDVIGSIDGSVVTEITISSTDGFDVTEAFVVVPEPASVTLLLAGAAFVLRRRP